MSSKVIMLSLIPLAIAGILIYTTVQSQSNQKPANTESNTTINNDESVKTYQVDGKPFSFTPNEIRVKQGDKVRIVFKNLEGNHDFVIDEFNVKTDVIKANESQTKEFMADKKGTFEYYCSVGNGYHRQQGMFGKLIVE